MSSASLGFSSVLASSISRTFIDLGCWLSFKRPSVEVLSRTRAKLSFGPCVPLLLPTASCSLSSYWVAVIRPVAIRHALYNDILARYPAEVQLMVCAGHSMHPHHTGPQRNDGTVEPDPARAMGDEDIVCCQGVELPLTQHAYFA